MTAKQKMSRRNFIRSSVVMGGAWMVALLFAVFFQHITLVCDTGTFALQVIVL